MSEETTGQKATETEGQAAELSAEQRAELIQESKKYRQRAQIAESKLAELEAEREEQRKKDMAAKGEYEALLTETKAELESLRKEKERWTVIETTRRELLVGKLPEEKRKFAESMPLDQLEEFVDLETQVMKSAPGENRPGNPDTDKKKWRDLTREEKIERARKYTQ